MSNELVPQGNELFTPEQVIKALRDNNGVVSIAAKDLGCAVSTIMRYRMTYPEVEDAFMDLKQTRDDWVFGKLLEQIEKGKENSIHFYMRTQVEGFSEKKEIDVKREIKVSGDVNITADEQAAQFLSFQRALAQLESGENDKEEDVIDGDFSERFDK